jgi:hypothetical protein
VPTYKRPEYTNKCLEAMANDGCVYRLYNHGGEKGLREAILDFFEWCKGYNFKYIGKIDNDCIVPKGWVNELVKVMENTNADIISPNVCPSNAAFSYGEDTEDWLGYRQAKTVGGLWFMKYDLVKDMIFDRYDHIKGLKGAIPILKQIVNLNQAKVGWTTKVTVNDLGHWSGEHPEHIKSEEHKEYSHEVGRSVAW